MSRVFWLGLGVAAGVALSRKAQRTAHAVTPAGIAGNIGDAMRELAGAIGSFGADVRAGMVEREDELTDLVERRAGQDAGSGRPRHALAPSPVPRRADARARRADGRA